MPILSFDSTDDMLAYLEAQRPAEVRLTYDGVPVTADDLRTGYWLNVDSARDHGFTIIGRGEPSTYQEDAETEADLRERGYVIGRWFSVVAPTGEYGSTHVTRLQRLSEDVFNQMVKGMTR